MSKNSQMKIKMSDDFCFKTSFPSIKETQQALRQYAETSDEPLNWLKSDCKIPLFVDTNVLLDLYGMSISDRGRIVQIFDKNKERLYVPSQVETEFLRHRISRIKGLNSLVSELRNSSSRLFLDIRTSFENLTKRIEELHRNKMIQGDMYRLQTDIDTIKTLLLSTKAEEQKVAELHTALNTFETKLSETIVQTYDTLNLEYADPVLDTIANANILQSLSEEDLAFLRKTYDDLKVKYSEVKSTETKNSHAFPGCGDLSKEKKGFDPYGDFYIYHEIVKFMKQNNTDVIFLTNDVTKEDWVRKDEKPFLHYLVSTYHLTGHTLHIINAAKYLALSSTASGPIDTNEDDIESVPTNDSETEKAPDNGAEADNQPVQESIEFKSSYFKDITKDEFLDNLKHRLELSKDYYDGYVGEHYFIYKALGYQHYYYRTSIEVLEELIKEGIVKREKVEKSDHSFDALVIVEQTNEEAPLGTDN